MLQHSVIRSADLDAERQVILEEINMHEDSPEDVVHDLFTETLWPEHPLGARSSARSARSRRPPAARSTASTGATTSPGTSWSPRPATSRHDDVRSLLPRAWTPGGRCLRATPQRGTSARRHAAGPVGRRLVTPSQDRAGAHLPGHERARAHRPRPVRVPGREHGARRRHVVAAVPGDPGAPGARVLRLQLSLAVHRGRPVHGVRRHHARRGRSRSSGLLRRELEDVATAASPRRSSSARRDT